MKIGNNRISQSKFSRIKRKQRRSPAGKRNGIKAEDVSLSGNAGRLADVMNMIDLLPDVREEMVERLRHEVRTGNYRIYSQAVAEKILSEYAAEALL